MSGFRSYNRLAEQAEAHGNIALVRLYASISWPEDPFLCDVVDEADSFFYDGLDPKQPPVYWLLSGEEPVLGEFLPRGGLPESEFRRELPRLKLKPAMRAVGVVQLFDGRYQFIMYNGDLTALVEACDYDSR